jgi:heterodisulfide reductase subunit A
MMDAGRHPKIELLDYSEVVEVQGYVGNFKVRVRRKPRYVLSEKCTGCGQCTEACVLHGGGGRLLVPSEFDVGMGRRAAAYIPFAQAVPFKAVIDPYNCLYLAKGKCSLKCIEACGPGAIDLEMEETYLDLKVGSIVVATGYEMWDPTELPDYGYGKSPNIITGLEFERLTSSGGPTAGEILTDEGEKPERVAIIHCVGSRDERTHSYCSRFCCMYSLKQAHQIKEKTGAEVYSIYMDMRTFGKDYEEFYGRIRDEGIQFIQGRPSQVTVDSVTGKLFIDVEDILLGSVMELEVDMVVLATAIQPPADADQVASTFGLGRTSDGWFAEAHPKLRPVETATAGVFLAGCAQGPRDVPDTVAHAGAAASEAVRLFNQGEVTISPTVAVVDADKCVGCGDCIPTCPYTAIARGAGEKAQVNSALCQGCGACVAACPSGAITALHFTDEEIVAQIDGLLELAV